MGHYNSLVHLKNLINQLNMKQRIQSWLHFNHSLHFLNLETDNYGYFGTINRYTDENQLHWFKYNKENDLMLYSGYEYLEPLLPISSVDGSNNSQSSISSQTLSLYNHDGMFALSNRKSVATSEAQNCNDSRPSLDDAGNDLLNNSQYMTSVDSSESSLLDLEEIDTKDVAEKVSMELKKYNISQVLFAQKILDRSQGTLSDLLRNPKPWTKLKSGRETFGRMLKWLNEPENERLSPLGVTGLLLMLLFCFFTISFIRGCIGPR